MKKTFDIFSKTMRGWSISSMYNIFREIFDLIVKEHKSKDLSIMRFYIKGDVYYNLDLKNVIKDFPSKGDKDKIIVFEDIYNDRFWLSENGNDNGAFDMIFDAIFNRYGTTGIHSVVLDTDYIMTNEQGMKYYDSILKDVFDKIDGKVDIDECLSILLSSFNNIMKNRFIYRFGHIIERSDNNILNIQLLSADYGERVYDVLFEDGGNRVLRIK